MGSQQLFGKKQNDLEWTGQTVSPEQVFRDYRASKARNTINRQDTDLALFVRFLGEAGIDTGSLSSELDIWKRVTGELVKGFVKWQIENGYAIGSINVRLSTVKTYANLAAVARILDPAEYALIRRVSGFDDVDAILIDIRRTEGDVPIRIGARKSEPATITRSQAVQLKDQPDTAQGWRDRLLMCLLLDHGLTRREVASLQIEDFDLEESEFHLHRPKVDQEQIYKMTTDTTIAAQEYLAQDGRDSGPLLSGSTRGGRLAGLMSERAVTYRVKVLGKNVGIKQLNAQDCRRYWTVQEVKSGTSFEQVVQDGGWSSPIMPYRYLEDATHVNKSLEH